MENSVTPPPVTPVNEPSVPPPSVAATQSSLWLKGLMIVGSLILAAVMGAGIYYWGYQQGLAAQMEGESVRPPASTPIPSAGEPTICTLEAKICPDGSSVGRSGPNCEFAPCPGEATSEQSDVETANWRTYQNSAYSYSFQYPPEWEVQDEATSQPASPTSKVVLIFNPADNQPGFMYTGMRIEYLGMVQDLGPVEATTINGEAMYRQNTMHGENYFVLMPGTDQYLYITGAGGYTANEVTNQTLQRIFRTFAFNVPASVR